MDTHMSTFPGVFRFFRHVTCVQNLADSSPPVNESLKLQY